VIGKVPAVKLKSAALVPLTVRFEITRFPVPVLLIVTVAGELLLPTS
jgi:hypothetical protein